MAAVTLALRKDGKPSVTLRAHGDHHLRVVNPGSSPHEPGRAWSALAKLDGLTIAEVHAELRRQEPAIQGRVGRPLGWVVDAIMLGNVKVVDVDG